MIDDTDDTLIASAEAHAGTTPVTRGLNSAVTAAQPAHIGTLRFTWARDEKTGFQFGVYESELPPSTGTRFRYPVD